MPTKPPLTAIKSAASSRDHSNLGPAPQLLSTAGGVALIHNGFRLRGLARFTRLALGTAAVGRGYSELFLLTHEIDQTAGGHFMQGEADWSSRKAMSGSVTIKRPRAEVFAFFLAPDNLAKLMPGPKRRGHR
jgi:uncharacterized membrane protein